jgi:hypothetical protein
MMFAVAVHLQCVHRKEMGVGGSSMGRIQHHGCREDGIR